METVTIVLCLVGLICAAIELKKKQWESVGWWGVVALALAFTLPFLKSVFTT